MFCCLLIPRPVAQTTELAWTGMRAAAIKLALINQTSPAGITINNEPWPKLRNAINWKHSGIHLQFQEKLHTTTPLSAMSVWWWMIMCMDAHCVHAGVCMCTFVGLWSSCIFCVCIHGQVHASIYAQGVPVKYVLRFLHMNEFVLSCLLYRFPQILHVGTH